MKEFSHNGQRVSSLIEDTMLGKIYDEPTNGDNNKPKTNVVIGCIREKKVPLAHFLRLHMTDKAIKSIL